MMEMPPNVIGPGLFHPEDTAKAKLTPQLDKLLDQVVATKHDGGKPDWSILPFEALEETVRVLEFGAKKYARNNWRENGGFKYNRVLTACLRHIFAFMRGEDKDPETGLSHLSHAMCNLIFLSYYLKNPESFKNNDDRNL
jgi:hypothetical protein